jgi:hypothetical protein
VEIDTAHDRDQQAIFERAQRIQEETAGKRGRVPLPVPKRKIHKSGSCLFFSLPS